MSIMKIYLKKTKEKMVQKEIKSNDIGKGVYYDSFEALDVAFENHHKEIKNDEEKKLDGSQNLINIIKSPYNSIIFYIE